MLQIMGIICFLIQIFPLKADITRGLRQYPYFVGDETGNTEIFHMASDDAENIYASGWEGGSILPHSGLNRFLLKITSLGFEAWGYLHNANDHLVPKHNGYTDELIAITENNDNRN